LTYTACTLSIVPYDVPLNWLDIIL